jgi:chromosome segregation ATPase
MNDGIKEERELETKVYELARVKISELQHNVFILEANLGVRLSEVAELKDENNELTAKTRGQESRINTLVAESESEEGDIDEIQRKLDLVTKHRDQLEEEISSLKNPYETVIELEPVVETVVHEGQSELNLLDAVQVEEPQPKEETWEEGIMLETIDGTDD